MTNTRIPNKLLFEVPNHARITLAKAPSDRWPLTMTVEDVGGAAVDIALNRNTMHQLVDYLLLHAQVALGDSDNTRVRWNGKALQVDWQEDGDEFTIAINVSAEVMSNVVEALRQYYRSFTVNNSYLAALHDQKKQVKADNTNEQLIGANRVLTSGIRKLLNDAKFDILLSDTHWLAKYGGNTLVEIDRNEPFAYERALLDALAAAMKPALD